MRSCATARISKNVARSLKQRRFFTLSEPARYDERRMPTTRQVLETTIALEKQSMALYARFAKLFAGDPKLKEFWSEMARDEARHVGALELVATVVELDGKLDQPSSVSLEDSTILRLRSLHQQYGRDAKGGLPIQQALRMALEVEENEVEDLVAHLLEPVQSPDECQRSLRLLVHDLGDLSYMIERHCQDPELLRRCDALVNRHAESLRRRSPN
jgi:rubrerythrin